MKIYCKCGGRIVDQTDYLPNKGHIISDQDWFDFLDAIDNAIEKSGSTAKEKERACMHIRNMTTELTKLIYQCNECGNLYIDNNKGELETFIRSEPFEGNGILKSAYGENWRRPLIGDWNDTRKGSIKGYLWCIDVKGDDDSFHSWELLEERYYSMFQELKKKNTLRSAVLKKNYEVIHRWDDDSKLL